MNICCEQDDRRDAVRSIAGRNGLDYVEVLDDQLTLHVYLLGKLPQELSVKSPALVKYFQVTGGHRTTGIQVTSVTPVPDPDPEQDDFVVLTLDRYGDFSNYTLHLSGVENIDPRYDHVRFSFKVNCPSDLDCAPACSCAPPELDEPQINYLAKDYASFNQLILDRLALLMPGWTERHAADLGMVLVELMAYTGDYLSYHQDAVATEAYLETARQRISVRRHARLVDYTLHEGCNARAWVLVNVSVDTSIPKSAVSFLTGLNDALPVRTPVLSWDDLEGVPSSSYEVFEPLTDGSTATSSNFNFLAAQNDIQFYTWGERECCLKRGSTSATVRDPLGALQLKVGDVLVLEEVISPTTGLTYDADPKKRCAVRLTAVTPAQDPVYPDDAGKPASLLELEWGKEDALPYAFCLSAIGPAPGCAYIDNVSVAHGNVVLVDHGQTQPPIDLGQVSTLSSSATCDCAGEPSDVRTYPGQFKPTLPDSPVTYSEALPTDGTTVASATALVTQDEREATPQVTLTSDPAQTWTAKNDLIESSPSDNDFVVEVDSGGFAHLRFGDGELGAQPPAGMTFSATYRVGNGTAGNVGAEAISRLVLKDYKLDGSSITVRNPLPASGGMDPEPMEDAKMFAPTDFRQVLQRAITAADYQTLAEENKQLQGASAELVWTGSWYEADVAIDPLGTETAKPTLLKNIKTSLEAYRRIGQDLAVKAARYVPIYLELAVCVEPDYLQAHVKSALLDVFSQRKLAGGKLGFFHPDNMTFGEDIDVSRIVAAGQVVPGVECVTVKRLHRLFEKPNHELQNGVLPLTNDEIPQLDNDPSFPEHGVLKLAMRGGR
ncbi:putative baseplate assembly protein [Granulicella arctica]|uniref:putative baseplate assembly protein n=1 Tax=Granulicella arctica TaxID=940613 RepID=UPI0021E0F62E|nr:putative baseplate assembly protein [Granulicella arctica]